MILAPHFFASSGRISGSGFDSAKMIGSEFIVFISSAEMRFGLLTPTNTSAPTRASLREPLHCPLKICFSPQCLICIQISSSSMDNSFTVCHDNMLCSVAMQKLCNTDSSGTSTSNNDFNISDFLFCEF